MGRVGTLAIGVLLVIIAVTLSIEMKTLLIGESATSEHVAAIDAAVRGVGSVTRIIDLKTQHIGPDELLVAGKIEFERTLSNPELSDAIDEVEAAIRRAVPLTMQVYLEPDLYDPERRELSDRPG
jgi:divalent metal cation (Fe/Co/Zn/Cd) transporter